jgi:hypothetical protein
MKNLMKVEDVKGVCKNRSKWKEVPTNPHWARVMGYGLFSLRAIHKEGL